MLSKARHYIPSEELVSLYYAIFSSHMTYGCQIWHNNNVHSDKIKSAQNKAIRAITFSDFKAPPKPLMKEKNILSISDFIILQNILFVHDSFHDKLPLCFRNYFTLVSDVHNRTTIGSNIGTLYIPEIKTKFGNNSLIKTCVDSWNLFTRCLKCNLNDLSRSKLKYDIPRYMINRY